jgi:hypothetical protein
MKKLVTTLVFGLISINSFGFEIIALGTSNTNCKGAGQAYTNALNEMLLQEKINAQVINAGVDGDKPQFMMSRLEQGLKTYQDVKIVIFEPGPNERIKSFNLEASDDILKYLQKINMPSIYVSNGAIETNDDAEQRAKKYGAYYYGHWTKNVPVDREHRQFDMNGSSGGHMTVLGCQLWAQNMFPLLKQVIKDRNIQ